MSFLVTVIIYATLALSTILFFTYPRPYAETDMFDAICGLMWPVVWVLYIAFLFGEFFRGEKT